MSNPNASPTIGSKRAPAPKTTLKDFAPRFLDGYARANRQKPSGIAAKETILRVHLVPALGQTPLDAITTGAVQQLKAQLGNKAPKTVNNVLTVLNTLLKTAVAWDVLDRMPCTVRLVPTTSPTAEFHDFPAHEALVTAAKADDSLTYLVVLLGGEAGLRCGEIMALAESSLMASSSQPFQQCEVSGNERLLLGACPALQLTLAPQRSRPIGVRLRVDELHGCPPACEPARAAVVVAVHPPVEIVRLTDVQNAIGAAQDVEEVHVR